MRGGEQKKEMKLKELLGLGDGSVDKTLVAQV